MQYILKPFPKMRQAVMCVCSAVFWSLPSTFFTFFFGGGGGGGGWLRPSMLQVSIVSSNTHELGSGPDKSFEGDISFHPVDSAHLLS